MPSAFNIGQAITDIQDDNRKARNILSRTFRQYNRMSRKGDPEAGRMAMAILEQGRAAGYQVGGIANYSQDRNFAQTQGSLAWQQQQDYANSDRANQLPADNRPPQTPVLLTPDGADRQEPLAAGGSFTPAPSQPGTLARAAGAQDPLEAAVPEQITPQPQPQGLIGPAPDPNVERRRLGLPDQKAPGIYDERGEVVSVGDTTHPVTSNVGSAMKTLNNIGTTLSGLTPTYTSESRDRHAARDKEFEEKMGTFGPSTPDPRFSFNAARGQYDLSTPLPKLPQVTDTSNVVRNSLTNSRPRIERGPVKTTPQNSKVADAPKTDRVGGGVSPSRLDPTAQKVNMSSAPRTFRSLKEVPAVPSDLTNLAKKILPFSYA